MNERNNLTKEWFKKAENDLLAAKIILQSESDLLPLDTVCFHCQQATEKFLKAFLIYHGVSFPYTHLLESLIDQCKEIDGDFGDLDYVNELTPYAVEIRYSDDCEEIQLIEAQNAFDIACRAKSFIISKVKL